MKVDPKQFQIRELSEETWAAYADLIERHNGVWGGCWCMGFQNSCQPNYESLEAKKCAKEDLVKSGEARATVVFDGDLAIGWCQYGKAEHISPRNKFKRLYYPGLKNEPDWRITCFYVDRKYRGLGVSSMALDGALNAISKAGGGFVEAYPEVTEGRNLLGAFTYLGLIPMFEKRGFVRQRQVAKHHWVMTKTVEKSQ